MVGDAAEKPLVDAADGCRGVAVVCGGGGHQYMRSNSRRCTFLGSTSGVLRRKGLSSVHIIFALVFGYVYAFARVFEVTFFRWVPPVVVFFF